MKKLISALICTAMLLSLMTPAFAAVTEYDADALEALNETLEYPLLSLASKNDLGIEPVKTDTPEKFLFKVDGTSDTKSYTLLKSVNAEADDGYFVMVADTALTTDKDDSAAMMMRNAGYAGTSETYPESKAISRTFDATDPASIAYYLNQQTYIEKHFADMKDYIETHKWYVEKRKDSTGDEAYLTESKVALISTTELKANSDRITAYNRLQNYNPDRFNLRTPHWNSDNSKYSSSTYTAPTVWQLTAYSDGRWNLGDVAIPYNWQCAERPCFYLSEDFFRSVKLDMNYLTAADSEAGKLIKKLNEENKLVEGLYTDAELALIASVGLTSSNDNLLGTTLTAPSITVDGYTTSYRWQRDGVAIENATSNTYTTVWADLGTSIACMVTLTGSDTLEAMTSAVAMEAKPTLKTTYNYSSTIANTVADTPAQYKFNVEGTDYVLLKSVNADEGDGYFAALNTPIFDQGIKYYDADIASATKYIYDPTDTLSWAYDVNQTTLWDKVNTWSGNKYGTIIPNVMRKYLERHRWWNEAIATTKGAKDGLAHSQDPFTTVSEVALMSYTELVENADRIGYNVPDACLGSYLRTPSIAWNGATPAYPRLTWIKQSDGNLGTHDPGTNPTTTAGSYYAKRICFYLDPEFFATEKLDIVNMGAEVRKIVKSELGTVANAQSVGYTNYEMSLLGFTAEEGLEDINYTNVAIEADAETAGEYAISYDLDYVGEAGLSYQSIAAVYDEGGVLVAISAPTPVSATTPNRYPVTHTVSGIEDITKCSIKIFAWSDLTTLAPVSPMVFDGTYSELVDPT